MVETGKVKKIEGDVAIVTVDKKTECSKCGMCAFPKNANQIDIRAKNGVGAKKDQTVVIETTGDGKLTGIFLAFLVPLILIAVAGVIGLIVIESEIWFFLLSLIFIALWYTILAILDKKLVFLNRFCARVVEIKEEHNDNRTC